MAKIKIPQVNLVKVGRTSIPLFPFFLLLLILKLAGVPMSWFWVFFPLMLPLIFVAFMIVFVVVMLVIYIICLVGAALLERK